MSHSCRPFCWFVQPGFLGQGLISSFCAPETLFLIPCFRSHIFLSSPHLLPLLEAIHLPSFQSQCCPSAAAWDQGQWQHHRLHLGTQESEVHTHCSRAGIHLFSFAPVGWSSQMMLTSSGQDSVPELPVVLRTSCELVELHTSTLSPTVTENTASDISVLLALLTSQCPLHWHSSCASGCA
jgi:hypothetical protein